MNLFVSTVSARQRGDLSTAGRTTLCCFRRALAVALSAAACAAPAVLAVAVPSAGAAQVLVVPSQNMEFGLLTPGVPATITPTDIARRAAFSIEARGRFSLSFQLPTHMTNAQGAAIPLVFGSADGRVEIRHKVTVFDPATGVNIHINPAEQSAQVYLGARAQPTTGTPAGSYTATIVMVVAATGS
jgi:hypothetical protein